MAKTHAYRSIIHDRRNESFFYGFENFKIKITLFSSEENYLLAVKRDNSSTSEPKVSDIVLFRNNWIFAIDCYMGKTLSERFNPTPVPHVFYSSISIIFRARRWQSSPVRAVTKSSSTTKFSLT